MERLTLPTAPRPSRFALFMASKPGRTLRVALGATMIGSGLFLLGGPAGLVLAGAGLLPIVTGALNLCPVAPLWGGHFFGARYCAASPRRR
jgi:membrane-associated protease RseP (regulator of RpoE activity)